MLILTNVGMAYEIMLGDNEGCRRCPCASTHYCPAEQGGMGRVFPGSICEVIYDCADSPFVQLKFLGKVDEPDTVIAVWERGRSYIVRRGKSSYRGNPTVEPHLTRAIDIVRAIFRQGVEIEEIEWNENGLT